MFNSSGLPKTYALLDSIEAPNLITQANQIALEIYLSENDSLLLMPSREELSEFLVVARSIYESNVVIYTDSDAADAARFFGCYVTIE